MPIANVHPATWLAWGLVRKLSKTAKRLIATNNNDNVRIVLSLSKGPTLSSSQRASGDETRYLQASSVDVDVSAAAV